MTGGDLGLLQRIREVRLNAFPPRKQVSVEDADKK